MTLWSVEQEQSTFISHTTVYMLTSVDKNSMHMKVSDKVRKVDYIEDVSYEPTTGKRLKIGAVSLLQSTKCQYVSLF